MPKKKVELSDVLDAIKGMSDRIEKLEEKDVFTIKTGPTIDATPVPIMPEEPVFPVPAEYRAIVDELLSPKFGIKIEPDSDRPAFTFKLLVPKEYSNAPNQETDIRAKVLTYGEGALGVRTYVELVKANLGPDINAKISADKQ